MSNFGISNFGISNFGISKAGALATTFGLVFDVTVVVFVTSGMTFILGSEGAFPAQSEPPPSVNRLALFQEPAAVRGAQRASWRVLQTLYNTYFGALQQKYCVAQKCHKNPAPAVCQRLIATNPSPKSLVSA